MLYGRFRVPQQRGGQLGKALPLWYYNLWLGFHSPELSLECSLISRDVATPT